MPIFARTAKECLNVFRDHMAGLFAAVLNNKKRFAFERTKVDGVERATLGFLEGEDLAPLPIETTSHGKLDLYVSQALAAVATGGSGAEAFRLETWGYAYRLHVGNDPVFRWEYDKRPPNKYPRHHVQIHGTASAGDATFDLKHLHTPTGWVTVEEVIRFVIADLGGKPLCADWEDKLATSERAFFEQFTSKRYTKQ